MTLRHAITVALYEHREIDPHALHNYLRVARWRRRVSWWTRFRLSERRVRDELECMGNAVTSRNGGGRILYRLSPLTRRWLERIWGAP